MKKLIALALVGVTCLLFTACGNSSNEEIGTLKDQIAKLEEKVFSSGNNEDGNVIVGEWLMSDDIDFDMTFNEDHTGTAVQHETGLEKGFTWSYDEDADAYLVFIEGKSSIYFVKYSNVDGKETLMYYDSTGVRK